MKALGLRSGQLQNGAASPCVLHKCKRFAKLRETLRFRVLNRVKKKQKHEGKKNDDRKYTDTRGIM